MTMESMFVKPVFVKPMLTTTSSLSDWLDHLQKLHPKNIDLSLERLIPIAKKHGLIKPVPYVITVAGTNGKGSTCAMIAETLVASGYQVGVYSSPHIIHFEERVRINNKMACASDFCRAFYQIEQWRYELGLDEQPLTFFESVTLASLLLFKQAKLDVLVLEVGLGGRFDATNIVDHDLAIVTSVDLDHIAFLGDNIEKIGYEKAGIFRSHRPALCGQKKPPRSVVNYAKKIHAPFYEQGHAFYYTINQSTDLNQCSWNWSCALKLNKTDHYDHLPIPSIHLDNASTALMALTLTPFQISKEAINTTLMNIQVPGRFHQLASSPDVYIDVAHNPHAIGYLAQRLAQLKQQKGGAIHAVVGMMADKDIKSSLKLLEKIVDYWYPAGFINLPRGASALEIKQYLLSNELVTENNPIFKNINDAYQAAIVQGKPDDVIIAFGSFHVVEQMMIIFKLHL